MTSAKSRFSRRTFLEALGVGGALLPLAGTDAVQAAPAGVPRRVLFIGWTNGYIMDDWRPKGGLTDFTFGQTLQPLTPWRDRLIVIDGVGQKVHYEADAKGLGWGKDQWYGGHDGFPGVLTGVPCSKYADNLEWSGADSLDQFIATEQARSVTLPFPSLVVGPFSSGGYYGTMSYKGASPGITPEKDPFNLFKKLFQGRSLPAGQIDRTLLARKSILDYLDKEVTAFGTRLGGDDRLRIQAHLESIRAVEKQLSGAAPAGGGSCAAPDPGAAFDVSNNIANFPKSLQLLSDLVVTGFKCDLNRVANMSFTNAGGDNLVLSWLGADFTGPGDEYPTRQYHDITHNQGKSAAHRARKIRCEQWFYEQVAYVVKQLDSTKEGTGTMLSNTLVVVTNSMGSNHDSHLQPFVLIGNAAGYFATGKYLKVQNEAHNRVMVAIANAMGVDGTKFGAAKYATELPGLRA